MSPSKEKKKDSEGLSIMTVANTATSSNTPSSLATPRTKNTNTTGRKVTVDADVELKITEKEQQSDGRHADNHNSSNDRLEQGNPTFDSKVEGSPTTENDTDTDRQTKEKITFAKGTFREKEAATESSTSRRHQPTSQDTESATDPSPQVPAQSDGVSKSQDPKQQQKYDPEPGLEGPPSSANGTNPAKAKRRRNRRNRIVTTNGDTPIRPTEWKRRKRGRVARLVNIQDTISSDAPSKQSTQTKHFPLLPGNQYSTTLRRRAIRKWEDRHEDFSVETNVTSENGDEIYGDISLGMKLIVVGGRVIVQTLNALSDGRASPAQMAGVIQRGDVLLAVGSSSLVNLPIDQLMGGLKPLSSPHYPDGRYKRILKIRLETGAGYELLKSHEEGLKGPLSASANPLADGQGALNDMFTLFPMVDQLSGAPMFDEAHHQHTPSTIESNDNEETQAEYPSDQEVELSTLEDNEGLGATTHSATSVDESQQIEATPDELIATLLVRERALDRKRFASEFFNWNDHLSELLKETIHSSNDEPKVNPLTKSERLDLGTQIMKLTKNLTYSMEDLEKGKDLRSFKTWSSNFSLRSSASARRRQMMDAASIRSHRHRDSDDNSTAESVGSINSGSLGSVDGDALLLNLAAHDDIWRKQVVEALEKEIAKMEGIEESDSESKEDEKTEGKPEGGISEALSNELGAFLFGKSMNEIITKKTKSYTLPAEDITTVLFDLTTHIATTAPDEVTIFGGTTNSFSYQSSAGTLSRAKANLRADVMLANQFILQEALPVWLRSFRPLGLEQRRLFWPKVDRGSTGSYTGTNTLSSDADSLTVDSAGTPQNTNTKKKTLQEAIEYMELDVETRAETCFLVTYYFTQHILAQYMNGTDKDTKDTINAELTEFIQKYGTYLQIHSCLSFAAKVEADTAVAELLGVASHDPSHREAMKEIRKADDLTFYDVSKLSAVLKYLRQIREEPLGQRRKLIKNLSVAAYPDIQPWQVKKACLLDTTPETWTEDSNHAKFYYSYLSLLLDPVEGVEAARQDAKLVKEWCALSVGISEDGSARISKARNMDNFLLVASRTSSSHLAYRRDVATLLEYCMVIHDYSLALDLGSEIIESRKLSRKHATVRRVLVCLRQIGLQAVDEASDSAKSDDGFHLLKRVLKSFHALSTSDFETCRESIEVSNELLALLQKWKDNIKSDTTSKKMLPLIDFMIQESSPHDVLGALMLWSAENDLGPDLYQQLHTLLRRGVQYSARQELSGFLLRLKQMRGEYTRENKVLQTDEPVVANEAVSGGIWAQMSIGTLAIDK